MNKTRLLACLTLGSALAYGQPDKCIIAYDEEPIKTDVIDKHCLRVDVPDLKDGRESAKFLARVKGNDTAWSPGFYGVIPHPNIKLDWLTYSEERGATGYRAWDILRLFPRHGEDGKAKPGEDPVRYPSGAPRFMLRGTEDNLGRITIDTIWLRDKEPEGQKLRIEPGSVSFGDNPNCKSLRDLMSRKECKGAIQPVGGPPEDTRTPEEIGAERRCNTSRRINQEYTKSRLDPFDQGAGSWAPTDACIEKYWGEWTEKFLKFREAYIERGGRIRQ